MKSTESQDHVYEVAVVGAGPVGLELAVGLKRAGVDYVQFDAGQIGYTIWWFAPFTHFFSSNERIAVARVPLQTLDQSKATREEYLQHLRTVVQIYGLDVRTHEPVMNIEKRGNAFVLNTEPAAGAKSYRASKVVIATGGTARPRMLGVSGENLPHVDHYLRDLHSYFRRRVLIVGGRNSAVEAALRCYHAGARVSISYRGSTFDSQSIKYWLIPEITSLIAADKIHGYFNTSVREISATHVTLAPKDGEAFEVEADVVLALTGYVADMSLARSAGVELIGSGEVPAYNEHTMETNVPGIYVAGTAVGGTQEKYRLFIENCHVHVERILAAIAGAEEPQDRPAFVGPPEA